MTTPSIDAQTVTLELPGGVRHEPVPTLRAAQAVNKHFGRYARALQLVNGLSHEAIVFVLRVGAGLKDGEAPEFEEEIWRVAVAKAAAIAGEFLIHLINGGRRPGP